MSFFKKHKILTAVLAVVFAAIIAASGTVYYYLNKINYSNGESQIAPTLTGEESESDILNSGDLSTDEKSALSDADASIRDNMDDSKVWYSDDVTNILLMGIDYGSSAYPYGRSDSMIVVSVNKALRKIKLISFSRTAYVAIPGYNNTRLNHAHGYGGAALAIKTIENNYKIRIDNYASATFDSFEKIIDAFGGVDITLTSAEAKVLRSSFGGFSSAGTYHLTGKQALVYARTRKIDTDKDRTGRQRKVLLALSEKVKNMSLTSAIGLLDTVLPLVTTDMTKGQLLRQAANAYSYLNWDSEQTVVPHKSSSLVLRDGFEVVLVDWNDEVKYVHDLFYKDNEVKYETAA